jgi:hypothetical protein
MKEGAIFYDSKKNDYWITGKPTGMYYNHQIHERFYYSERSKQFKPSALGWAEQDVIDFEFSEVKIKDLPEDIKKAYVKWKLDRL